MTRYSEIKGEGRIECDDCGDEDDFSGDDFRDFLATAKSAGWAIQKTQLGWSHKCSVCAKP